MYGYVVGFAFTEEATSILLVRKNRPEWQKGCLNGIGGKIEDGETPAEAMSREAFEEAGIKVEWLHRGVMKGINYDGSEFECHIFYAYEGFDWEQKEDEPLNIYDPLTFDTHGPIVNNLNYLIPFGMYMERVQFLTLDY